MASASLSSQKAFLAVATLVAAALLVPARHAMAADDKARAPTSAYDGAMPPSPSPVSNGASSPPPPSPGDTTAVPPLAYNNVNATPSLLPLVPPPPPLPFVIIEGTIYCKSCKGKGYNTGMDASPLQGSFALLLMLVHSYYVIATYKCS